MMNARPVLRMLGELVRTGRADEVKTIPPSLRPRKTEKVLHSYVIYRQLLILLLPGIEFYHLFCRRFTWSVQIAFKDFNYRLGIWRSPWIGYEYFTQILTSPSFGEVFRNTMQISLYKPIFSFPAPILLALLLFEIYHNSFRKVVQTISYLPSFE